MANEDCVADVSGQIRRSAEGGVTSMRVAITFGNEARLGSVPSGARRGGDRIGAESGVARFARLACCSPAAATSIRSSMEKATRAATKWTTPGRTRADRLLREALAADLPVFAICRGLQMFNVVCGGTLIQHLPSSNVHRQRPPGVRKPGSIPRRMRSEFGRTLGCRIRSARVGMASTHGIIKRSSRLGEGLIVSAIADDGVIEAVEYSNARFAVAVQWHPEDRIFVSAADLKLFEAFAAALASPRALHQVID